MLMVGNFGCVSNFEHRDNAPAAFLKTIQILFLKLGFKKINIQKLQIKFYFDCFLMENQSH